MPTYLLSIYLKKVGSPFKAIIYVNDDDVWIWNSSSLKSFEFLLTMKTEVKFIHKIQLERWTTLDKGQIINDFVNIPLHDGTDPVHRPSWPHFMESGPTKR